jgi:magnesium transporter
MTNRTGNLDAAPQEPIAPEAPESDDASASDGEPTLGLEMPRWVKPPPGSAPGIEHHELAKLPSAAERTYVSCVDYCPDHCTMVDIIDIDEFLAKHRPEWSAVRWINVDGLTDMNVIHAIATKYQLHPLAVEDVLHVHQRPKVDSYAAEGDAPPRLFIVARMNQYIEDHLQSEQVSMFLGRNTVLTFQETHGDVWMPIRERICRAGSRLRLNDASFLVYALLDAMVDHCFPILEHYGDRLEDLEDDILEDPGRHSVHEIHQIKREILLLRRQVWPMREMVLALQREPLVNVSETTRTYMRDVYDHTVQAMDILETYRDLAVGLTETYMTAMSNRMNEVMKVLTLIATIFIPITFLAGVYGMNFRHFPELDLWWAYPLFWVICFAVAGTMLIWFKRRGWL